MHCNELAESLELSKAMSNAIMWQALGGMLRLFCWNLPSAHRCMTLDQAADIGVGQVALQR